MHSSIDPPTPPASPADFPQAECLARVTALLAQTEVAWWTRLHRLTDVIPLGFQDAGEVTAHIRLGPITPGAPGAGDRRARSSPIRIDDQVVGLIEILGPAAPPREPSLLDEEARLLEAIADRIADAYRRHDTAVRLQRSDNVFRSLAERSGLVLGVTTRSGRIQELGGGAEALFGIPPAELIGASAADLVRDEDREPVLALIERATLDPDETQDGRFRFVHRGGGRDGDRGGGRDGDEPRGEEPAGRRRRKGKGGGWKRGRETRSGEDPGGAQGGGPERWVELTLRNRLDDAAIGGLVLTALDVSHHLEQDRRIHHQAEILDSVGQAVTATGLDGRITYWNRAAERLYGWSREEVQGRHVLAVALSASGRSQVRKIVPDLLQGRAWSGELECRRRDGSVFLALVVTSPILDASGTLTGLTGTISDLTDHKRLEEQLHRAQRLESIGRLAGGVAHDFNNILTVIGGHCSLLQAQLALDPAAAEHAHAALEAVQRAARLTRQLLAFSRRQVVDPTVVDLREALQDLAPMLRRLIPERIDVRFRYGAAPAPIEIDEGHLQQVLLNLAVNAKDAIDEAASKSGSVLLQVSRRTVSPSEAEAFPWQMHPGTYVQLKVRDTGVGISPEVQDQVFEPFFTTKPTGSGTGLGLSMTYGIVKQAGGHVLIDSAPGEGCTFELLFPLTGKPLSARPGQGDRNGREAAESPNGDEADRGSRTVLLVEDDPSVRELAREVLLGSGFRLLVAADGAHAVELAREHHGRLDAVVTDVVMPGLGGAGTVARLRQLQPDLKIVLMSGYPRLELPEIGLLEPTAFLPKPFTPGQLRKTLDEALKTTH